MTRPDTLTENFQMCSLYSNELEDRGEKVIVEELDKDVFSNQHFDVPLNVSLKSGSISKELPKRAHASIVDG